MEYNKLPPQPPPYPVAAGWNVPPPPTEPVQSPAPVVTLMHHNTVVIDSGQGMVCPECNARVRMRVEHHATWKTYFWAAVLCLCLCWPCVCLPCCCNCGYKTTQFCPNCNARLGSF